VTDALMLLSLQSCRSQLELSRVNCQSLLCTWRAAMAASIAVGSCMMYALVAQVLVGCMLDSELAAASVCGCCTCCACLCWCWMQVPERLSCGGRYCLLRHQSVGASQVRSVLLVLLKHYTEVVALVVLGGAVHRSGGTSGTDGIG
jgi:hypothetical protein